MKIFEASAKSIPLVGHPPGWGPEMGGIPFAEIFRTPDGLVAVVPFYFEDYSGKAFLRMDGPVLADGPPWTVAGWTIRPVEDGDAVAEVVNAWRRFLASDEGKPYDRESIRRALVARGVLPE